VLVKENQKTNIEMISLKGDVKKMVLNMIKNVHMQVAEIENMTV